MRSRDRDPRGSRRLPPRRDSWDDEDLDARGDLDDLEDGLDDLVAPGAARRRPLSVSELNRMASELLGTGFGVTWVEGEVSSFTASRPGHWYFTLKDGNASVQVVMFRGSNRFSRARPCEGMQLVARGRVTVYEVSGRFQVIADHVEPAGEGALLAALERLKRRLTDEGLFDADRKRPLPLLPSCVGVATSRDGAALHDVLRVLAARGARLRVVVSHCRVQGDGAALDVVRALRRLEAVPDIDAIIVGRGGGSLEDLWCFNDETLARTVSDLGVPVISAVGHEVDTTLCDLAADVRAATPSQAAELVSASRLEVEGRVDAARRGLARAVRVGLASVRERAGRLDADRLARAVSRRLERRMQRRDELDRRLAAAVTVRLRESAGRLRGLDARLSPRAQRERLAWRRRRLESGLERLLAAMPRASVRPRERLDAGQRRLALAARRQLDRRAQRRSALEARLLALSPLAVLDRGYAVLRRDDGRVVRGPDEVEAGEELTGRVARGELALVVRGAAGTEGAAREPGARDAAGDAQRGESHGGRREARPRAEAGPGTAEPGERDAGEAESDERDAGAPDVRGSGGSRA